MFFFSTSQIHFRPVRNSGFREEDSRRRKDATKPSNDLLELADINFGNPLVQPPPAPTRTIASSSAGNADPWGMVEPAHNDPWGGGGHASQNEVNHDPWSPVQQQHHAIAASDHARASPLVHGGLASPGPAGDGLYPGLSKKKRYSSFVKIIWNISQALLSKLVKFRV